MSQTPWLQGPGLDLIRVGLPGASSTDKVQVTVFDQVRTRTDFDNDASGHVDSYHFYQKTLPVAALPGDPSPGGGADIELPVDQAAPAHDPFDTPVQIGETGVFPVQIQLYDASGTPLGVPLTTFIVFTLNAASAGTLKPLSAAVIIPVSSAPVVSASGGLGTPGSEETSRLLALAEVLNADSSVPATILASPVTVDELAADHSLISQLNGTAAGGPVQVLPSTYSPVSLGDLANSLPGEIQPQLQTGSAVLKSVFGAAPDNRTWVVDGPLDGATLGVLIAHHVQQVIVPNGDLTPLPGEIQITFAGSTYLDYAGSVLRVISADNTLTADFSRDEPPVLAANQLLAELAMIYTEAPNAISPRGLAVLPPPGWSASAEFVQTLLNGLQGNPLVSAVTASQLFSSVGQPQGTRYLASLQPQGSSIDQATSSGVTTARGSIDESEKVFGPSPELDLLQKQLLLAESSNLSDNRRRVVLNGIARATNQVQHVASLPPATTITLTSTKGQIPLTILVAGNAHPRIQLHLRSQRLIFRPFSPKEGECRAVIDTEEICTLSLTSQNTTLNVPVETRSSGVFPLDVMLEVPGTSNVLQHDRDTVRSTAVSGVAVIVIVVALAGLVLWWGRDLRRGRRPKGMAPAPVDISLGDPDVEGFFDQEPPDYGGSADGTEGSAASMSPSRAVKGPSLESNKNGQARETRKM